MVAMIKMMLCTLDLLGGTRFRERMMQIGTGISLLGVASFFLGLGSKGLSVIILGAQVSGGRVIRERPIYSATWTFFSFALTALGVGLLYLVVARFFL